MQTKQIQNSATTSYLISLQASTHERMQTQYDYFVLTKKTNIVYKKDQFCINPFTNLMGSKAVVV